MGEWGRGDRDRDGLVFGMSVDAGKKGGERERGNLVVVVSVVVVSVVVIFDVVSGEISSGRLLVAGKQCRVVSRRLCRISCICSCIVSVWGLLW